MSELQRLRDRVEELESLLGLERDLAMRIRHAWRMASEESRIMSIVLKRAFATRETLYTILYGARPDCDQPEMKIVDVQVCKARKSLRNNGVAAKVRTKWGDGYFMTREDKAALMAALERAEELPDAVERPEYLPAFLSARAA